MNNIDYYNKVLGKLLLLRDKGLIDLSITKEFISKEIINEYPEDFQYFITEIGFCSISTKNYLLLEISINEDFKDFIDEWSGSSILTSDISKQFIARNTDSYFYAYERNSITFEITEHFGLGRNFCDIFHIIDEHLNLLTTC